MRILNENLLNAGDASGNLTSNPLLLAQAFGYSVQCVFSSASIGGTLKLQGSADPVPEAQFVFTPPTNWTDLSGTSTMVTTGGNFLFNAEGTYYNWVRVVFTASAGTGTLTVVGNTKGF